MIDLHGARASSDVRRSDSGGAGEAALAGQVRLDPFNERPRAGRQQLGVRIDDADRPGRQFVVGQHGGQAALRHVRRHLIGQEHAEAQAVQAGAQRRGDVVELQVASHRQGEHAAIILEGPPGMAGAGEVDAVGLQQVLGCAGSPWADR